MIYKSNMKQIPILFSTPMVQAIIEGRKTQTRRVIKPQPVIDPDSGFVYDGKHKHAFKNDIHHQPWQELFAELYKAQPGDVLYVRETFAHGSNGLLDSNIGKPENEWSLRYWVYKDGSQLFSDGQYFQGNKNGTEESFKGIRWTPSIHMPKVAVRIWLEVVSVRVERLQDISEDDAQSEGVTCYERETDWMSAKFGFNLLWNDINGEESWNANPWVWVIEFKRIEKPC